MSDMQVVNRFFDAWNRHDAAAVEATFGEGATYADPTVPGGVSGANLLAVVQGFLTAFPDMSIEIAHAIDGGTGMIAVEYVVRGTHTGPLGPMPATGRSFAMPGVDIFRVEGGAIREARGHFDTGTLFAQLGAGAAPEG